MDITLDYASSPETYTFTGSQPIVNRTTSELGNGWWLDGLDRLHTDSSGALLVTGDETTYEEAFEGIANYLKLKKKVKIVGLTGEVSSPEGGGIITNGEWNIFGNNRR